MKRAFTYSVILVSLLVPCKQAKAIENFFNFGSELFRGSQPSKKDIQKLKEMGVKTVLNLRDNASLAEKERKIVEGLGMRYVNIPLAVSPFYRPSMRKLDQIYTAMSDERNYPLYVHCRAGKDRTGLAVGVFKVLNKGIDPDQAYKDMLQKGFGSYLLGFNCAFKQRLGQPLPGVCNLLRPQD